MLIGFLISNLLPEWDPALAWLVAMLFIVHPMHVEVVASIKNRDEILAMLFFAAGWLALIRLKHRPWLAISSGLLFLSAIDFQQALFIDDDGARHPVYPS